MKKLILLALTFVMCGCAQKNEDGSLKLNTGFITKVVIIDSCEYISYNGGYGLAHKGNCKYCAKRRKKGQEALIRKLK